MNKQEDVILTPEEAEELGVTLNHEILNDDDFLSPEEWEEKQTENENHE